MASPIGRGYNKHDSGKENMQTIATCAACGEKKELCGSCRIDGIQQPRVCKDCLMRSLRTGDYGVNDLYWLVQLGELNDTESIEALKANAENQALTR